jgi:NACalpha-BTF3-like transcription factor
MKITKFNGKVETFLGKPVNPPVLFEGTFEELENNAEIPAKELPNDADILAYVNTARKAKARAEAQTEELKKNGYEKPDANTPEAMADQQVKLIMKRKGVSYEKAQQIMAAMDAAADAL